MVVRSELTLLAN